MGRTSTASSIEDARNKGSADRSCTTGSGGIVSRRKDASPASPGCSLPRCSARCGEKTAPPAAVRHSKASSAASLRRRQAAWRLVMAAAAAAAAGGPAARCSTAARFAACRRGVVTMPRVSASEGGPEKQRRLALDGYIRRQSQPE
eukprot:COSAG01_NODE_4546_length_4932_cov_10.841092_5_plen_146_part_00